jgi:hypothetical protein
VGIYRALLDEIVRRDYDVLTARVSLPTWRKVAITIGSLPSRFGPAKTLANPQLDPVLVESPRCG